MNTRQWWWIAVVVLSASVVMSGCGGGGPAVVAGLDGGLVGDWLFLADGGSEPAQDGEGATPVTMSISPQGQIRVDGGSGLEWLEGSVEGAYGSGTVVWTNCSVEISQISPPPLNEPIIFSYSLSGSRVTLEYAPEVAALQWGEGVETYVKLRDIGPIMLQGNWLVRPAPGQEESWDAGDFKMVWMARDGRLEVRSYAEGYEVGFEQGQWLASGEDDVLWQLPSAHRQASFETDAGYAILDFGDEEVWMQKREVEPAEGLAGNWSGDVGGEEYSLFIGAASEEGTVHSCWSGWLVFEGDEESWWAEYELSGGTLIVSKWDEGVEQQMTLGRSFGW